MTDRTRIDLRCVPGFALAIAIVFVIPVSLRFRGTAPGGGHVHLLIACAVVALGLAVLPATAGAASITVTPNTGLNYFGQDVNVTGTGWRGNPRGTWARSSSASALKGLTLAASARPADRAPVLMETEILARRSTRQRAPAESFTPAARRPSPAASGDQTRAR